MTAAVVDKILRDTAACQLTDGALPTLPGEWRGAERTPNRRATATTEVAR